jgi:quercetin dioxygenase-like cupin family protein
LAADIAIGGRVARGSQSAAAVDTDYRVCDGPAVGVHRELEFHSLDDGSDPDDWRPGSRLALVADPDANLAVIVEKIGVGDAVPLHRHTIDEVVFYLSGEVEVRLDEASHSVRAGDIIVIPAGVAHAQRNTGDSVAEIRAVFPSARLDVEYLERNPAPGTEGDPPQPPFVIDTHTGKAAPAK